MLRIPIEHTDDVNKLFVIPRVVVSFAILSLLSASITQQYTMKRLELHSAAPRPTLPPLSCSPNFPRAQHLDIRTLTHELIVNLFIAAR